MSKLYLRLYLFAVAIMVTSSLIASVVMGFVIRREGPPPEVLIHTSEEAKLMGQILIALPGDDGPWLKKIAEMRNWDISIWRDGRVIKSWGGAPPTAAEARQIINTPSEQARWVSVPVGPDRMLIHPKPFKDGPAPWLRVFPPLLPFLLTLLSMMLLLIPFVQRIVRPFRNLLASIRRVSVGNYEHRLELPKGSEFQGLADEFNHMTGQIQKTLAQKQRLIADVSHELRSPLARLRLSLDLMEKRGTVPEKYYNKAVSEVEYLDALIDDLLDASRLELRANFAPQTTEMREYLQGILEKNQLLFSAHPLEVRFQHPEQQVWCDVDRELLERTFNNLISNTLKHAKPPAFIELTLTGREGMIEIFFRDNGPGVSAEDCQKIFEPFYRTDDSRTRSTGGVGLGLSIVRKIIQLHRGDVWAQVPDDGKGGLMIGIRLPALVVNSAHTGLLV